MMMLLTGRALDQATAIWDSDYRVCVMFSYLSALLDPGSTVNLTDQHPIEELHMTTEPC